MDTVGPRQTPSRRRPARPAVGADPTRPRPMIGQFPSATVVATGNDIPGVPAPRRIWPVLTVVALFYVPLLVDRLRAVGARGFVHLGRIMLTASTSSPKITPSLGWHSNLGYDGQYYFALAVDPIHAKNYFPPSLPGIVYSRPLYPAVTGLLGGGSVTLVPYAMLIVNLAALVGCTFALALLLRRRNASPWFALLYATYPGVVFCVFRDLTEPLAFALVAAAWVLLDARTPRAVGAAAVLSALAVLTRETTIVFALVAALALVVPHPQETRQRTLLARWPRAVIFFATAVIPLLVWRTLVGRFVHAPTQERTGGLRSLVPFHGIAHYWPWNAMHVVIVVAVVVPTVLAMIAAAPLFRRGLSASLPALALWLSGCAFVLFLPADVDVNWGGAGRAAIGVVFATVIAVPSWYQARRINVRGAVAAGAWTLPVYTVASIATGFAGFAAMIL